MCGQFLPQQSKSLGCWPRCGEGRVRRQPVKIIGVKVRYDEFVGYCLAEGAGSRARSTKNVYAGHPKDLVERPSSVHQRVVRRLQKSSKTHAVQNAAEKADCCVQIIGAKFVGSRPIRGIPCRMLGSLK